MAEDGANPRQCLEHENLVLRSNLCTSTNDIVVLPKRQGRKIHIASEPRYAPLPGEPYRLADCAGNGYFYDGLFG